MTSRAEILKERLKARRARLGNTTADSDHEVSPRHRAQDTWTAAMEEEESVERTIDSLSRDAPSVEMEDEVKQSEQLVDNLQKRRKRTQKELTKTLKTEDGDDVKQQLRVAKKKTKQRFLEETAKSGTDGEETAASAEPEDSLRIPRLDIGGDDDGDTARGSARLREGESPGRTSARTPRTAREDGQTPRKVPSTLASSIRAKLSQKIRAAKDKGKDEAYDESRQAERRLRGQRGLGRSTRFDDPSTIRDEEMEAEALLEKSLAMKSKWKEVVDTAQGKLSLLPSEEEAFDFFTRQFEPDEEDAKPEAKPDAKPESKQDDDEPGEAAAAAAAADGEETEPPAASGAATEEAEPEETEEDKKKKKKKKKEPKNEDEEPLLDDIDTTDDMWQFYQMAKAGYKPFHEKMEDESKVYFIPSIRAAPLQEKIQKEAEPRYLEEEGIYVGVRPMVPQGNINKMENRLLREGEHTKSWFGEDGSLIALPDPLKEIPYRPPIVEDIDPALETEYKKAVISALDGRFIDGSADDRGHYQLDVDVNTIVFSHHHLFSKEHAYASKLADMYQQYLSRNRKKVADFLTEKLKALKSATNHVQTTIDGMKSNKNTNPQSLLDQEKRLKDYKDEIKQTRKQRDDEMMADRALTKHIIQIWRDIKNLRQTQNYTNTNLKLLIRKEVTNKVQDEAELQQEIEDELREIKAEAEEEYHRAMETYTVQLEKWKNQKTAKKEAQKRQRKRERRSSRGQETEENDLEEDQADQDREVLEEEEISKPVKPKHMTDADVKGKILGKFDEIRRKPGEPKLHFELTNSGTITPNTQCPREEQTRRNDINRHKLYVKVLFNNKEVSQTTPKALGQDFIVRFAQIFNIEIMQWPESIKMEIYEVVGMSSTLIAQLFAAIPEPNITVENVTLDDMEFSSDILKAHPHSGVGSGLTPDNKLAGLDMIMMTSGLLSNSVAWAVDNEGNILIPPTGNKANQGMFSAMKGMDAVSAIGVSGMSDMDKLTKWIAQSHLDPNDPSNAELMCLMRPSGGGDNLVAGYRMPDHFRLEQLQEEFNFVTDEDIDNSRRFRMIQLREQEVQAFRNKQVPINDKEIPDETFDEYEKQRREEERLKKKDEGESHRIAVAKFMQKVREQVMVRFRYLSHQKTLPEMVFEDAVPNIGTIIPQLMKIAEPRRPLKPIRKERKKVTAQNLQGVDVKVLVNIVRAFGIPIRAPESAAEQPRTPGTTTTRAPGGVKNIAGETQVRPYIEVMFQRNTQATSVADGPNPSWNEELALDFKPPNNDFSSANLQTIKDVVYFNIFDEYIVDVPHDDRDRGTSVLRRIERRWLGSIQIPFSTIYFNSRIEGTFRVDKPPVLLGYSHESKRSRSGGEDMDVGIGETNSTYITLFVTVDPDLVPAEPVKEKFDSNEDEKLLQAADAWQYEMEKKFPKREYKATVVDINGKSVFITRFLRALKPPDELLEGDDMNSKTEKLARYVSMIPFVSDSVVFPGLCDIWSTCDQFLQMLQGDEEEHAVLLANYFSYLYNDKSDKVYLLLGSAIPEGPTAYVMTREGGSVRLWNASTGENFSYRDNYCPLQSVGCVVTADNVWANIQPNDQPSRISYDIRNHKNWKPFFHKGFPNPGVTSVQPNELLYFPTDRDYVEDLQDKIERVLKEKIMEWRTRYITRWNRYCMQAFRRLLPKLENSRGKYGVQQEHSHEMEQILGSYKLCGFPINMPYTEMEPIIDSVFATGVHNYESSEVEFALAVHIHPYPNSVMSVWIYVANLVRKR